MFRFTLEKFFAYSCCTEEAAISKVFLLRDRDDSAVVFTTCCCLMGTKLLFDSYVAVFVIFAALVIEIDF